MTKLEVKHAGTPDEVRPFAAKGGVEVFQLGDGAIWRGRFEPGWKWSEHVKPLAGTKSCEAMHTGYVLSGRMKIVMNDGTEADLGPGDTFSIPSGHDAWVLGDQPCVLLDFTAADYAKKKAQPKAA